MTILKVSELQKSYGSVNAVRGISFEVAEGTIFGLIGPDGGGKTTTMRILVSLLSADQGSVTFMDHDVFHEPAFVRAHVGYMPQRFSLYQDLSVEENLRFFADLYRVDDGERRAREKRLYGFSGLEPFRSRRAGALSGGMKQKLALSCLLMHAPRVLVLDEPTFGVDPVSRAEFWDILKDLKTEGTTILVSTAYMDEAGLCDRVSLVHEGLLLATDGPANLTKSFPSDLFSVTAPNPHRAYEQLLGWSGTQSCRLFGDGIHLTLKANTTVETLKTSLAKGPSSAWSVRSIEPTLEDLFLHLMGA